MNEPKTIQPAGGFAIYIHWPFCRSKCPYCDFNSHVREGIEPARWGTALLADLERQAERFDRFDVASIFFGGGTPSLMPAPLAGRLIEAVAQRFSCAADIEITLEANPTSVEAETFADFKQAGVNRFSLGLQALDDAALAFLGRQHSVDESLAALGRAQASGARVSFDLIYARPGQSLDAWEAELTRALSFGVEHLSLYQLTLEPGTAFTREAERGRLTLPDADHAADMFDLTHDITQAAGLPAYEVSNHARPGAESRHNLVYWRGGSYLGIGPGAHGRPYEDGVRHASVNHRTPEDWLRAIEAGTLALDVCRALEAEESAEEYVLMGLRLSEGIELARYEGLSGHALDSAMLEAEGLLIRNQGRLAASPRGRLVLNSLIAALL